MRMRHWLYTIPLRLRSVFRRRQVEQELEDEFQDHLERLIEQRVAEGLTPTEARHSARRQMGGVAQRQEECRDTRRVSVVEDFGRDLRYAVRSIRKSPVFSVITILTLAVGIGANTAIFSAVHAVLMPLPVPAVDRVVMVWTDSPSRGWEQFPASVPDYRAWQASGLFSSLSAFREDGFNLRLADRTERIDGLRVTHEFFAALATPPAHGRAFIADDDQDGHDAVVVLSDRLWRSAFAASPDTIGRSLIVDGTPRIVIGVMPSSFARFGKEDVYVPLTWRPDAAADRGSRGLSVLGRLQPNVSVDAAQQQLTALSLNLARQFPADNSGLSARLQPLGEAFVEDGRTLFGLLLGAVGFVLAVACANIANLLLARGMSRRKEMAIRAALGGSRWRVSKQVLTENVVLAIIGGVLALVPAWWGTRFVASFQIDEVPNASLVALNGTVLVFNFVLAGITGILVGLVPSWLVWKNDVNATLRGAGVGAAGIYQRLRGAFAVGELALTLVLLIGAGLMLQSFVKLRSDSPGYNPDGVLTMRVAGADGPEASPARQTAAVDRIVERARTLPGVVGASAAEELPTSDDLHGGGLFFANQPEPRAEDIPVALHTAILPDYFSVMQMPLVRGRSFTRQDTSSTTLVAVIDAWTAKRYWPSVDPVGQRFKLGRSQPWLEIVGVVGDVEAPVIVQFLRGRIGQVYLPAAQDPKLRLSIVVRTTGQPASLATPMRAVVREVDADQPLFQIQTLNELRTAGQAPARLVTWLLGSFALVALILATIGVYGVMAWGVEQRTREFGIRMSLGAQSSGILRLVLGRGVVLIAAGVGLGVIGALALTRLLSSFLHGVQATDPVTFAAVIVVLAGVGLLASYIPARRATRINPVLTLRSE